MAVRQLGQLSLADALARRPGRTGLKLERIDALIDWRPVAEVAKEIHSSPLGAPGYPPLLMIKALLLLQWYGLSDEALEDALTDRLSFRRFVGLPLGEKAPDHCSIWRFRETLAQQELSEKVFAAVTRQIEAKGLLVRHGTMIDATLVEAQVKRPKPPKDEPSDETAAPEGEAEEASAADAAPANGAAPARPDDAAPPSAPPPAEAERPASKLVPSKTDPDASWAKKGGKRYFGYKGHVGVDQGSRIIRKAKLTTAAVQDTVVFEELLSGDERAVYADKAYDKKARRAALKARGVKDRIAHRGNKHHKITPGQERHNKAIGRRRYQVEQVFACAKRLYGWTRVRYRGLVRNAGHFFLICTALNLDRMVVLTR
jgi:transposase, IS5 family